MKTNPDFCKYKGLHLSAEQVCTAVERSGLTRHEFAQRVGCGTSQLFKYQKEGLPPRMNSSVRARVLEQAVDTGVVASSAALRAGIAKLLKGTDTRRDGSSE